MVIGINKFVDNVDIINKTCKLAGINRISAKTVDLEDDNVWNSIQNNTDLIFQVSGNFGSQTIRKIFSKESQNKIFKSLNNFTRMDLFAFTNALLRPCGKSIYNDAVNGNAHITNVKEIDNLLSSELGYPLFQETQMEFVMKFCGYSFLEADHLRKCIAEGSLITMSDGTLKPIEDVRVGDRVISFDGKVFSGKTVTAAWDNGIKDVVEVTLEDGISLKCTPDHRLLTQDGWKESSKLSSDDWVYTPRRIMCDDDRYRTLEKTISNKYSISADITENLSQHCLSPYTCEVLHGDFVCVPVKSIKKAGKSKVYDLTVEDNHNFIANNIVCHNCIGKKLGTKEELPIIKKGFEENAKKTFGLTDKESDAIINPFLQCILDATRYSFCRIHAYSYSYIGYICAYLRYYYPVEYATACLNVWQGKEEKTKEATEYCKSINIKIKEPVFRHGRPEYSSDSEHREVYKGMKSIKYLNDDCSNGLYLFRNNTYSTFSDLLYDIFHDEQCKINTKQLEILIRLDFFKEFGNSNELLYIYENFQKFKNGDAKSFSKSKTNPESILYSILKRNSTETEKTFTKLNAMNIVREIEEYIKCQNLKDIPIRKKMETQKEYLGYINLVTEKPEDRPKIIVLEKRVLIAKTGKNAGKPWCVVIDGQSIGSGKKSSYTIYYNNYIYNKFEEFDVIRIKNWYKKNDYYYIDEYEKEFE